VNFVLAVASMRINATIIPFTIFFDGPNKKNFKLPKMHLGSWLQQVCSFLSPVANFSPLSFLTTPQARGIHSLRTNINLQQPITFYIPQSRKINWVDNNFHLVVEATPSSIRGYTIEAIETRTHHLSGPRNSNIEFTADSCPPSQVCIDLNRQKSTLNFQHQDRKLFTFHYPNQLCPLRQLQTFESPPRSLDRLQSRKHSSRMFITKIPKTSTIIQGQLRILNLRQTPRLPAS
jgi:hypothetical protein